MQFILAYLFLAQLDTFLALQPRLAAIQGRARGDRHYCRPLAGRRGPDTHVDRTSYHHASVQRRTAWAHFKPVVFRATVDDRDRPGKIPRHPVVLPDSVGPDHGYDLVTRRGHQPGLWQIKCRPVGAGIIACMLCRRRPVYAESYRATHGRGDQHLRPAATVMDNRLGRPGQSGNAGMFQYLSLLRHFEPLLKGLFSTTDVAYYLLFIALFLGLTIRRLDADRLPH